VQKANRIASRLRRRSIATFKIIAAAGVVLAGPQVKASLSSWDNTTGNWSDGTHWGGSAPVSDAGNALTFGSGSADYTTTFDLGTGFQLNQLNLLADPGRTNALVASLTANTLDFVPNGATDPMIALSGGGTWRIGNNIRVGTGANLNLNVATGSALVFAGSAAPAGTATSISPVSGSAMVTVTGGGTVVWRSITTDMTVNNGLVTTDADGDFLGNNALTIGANGIVDTAGFAEGWGSISGIVGAQFRGSVNVGAATGNFVYAGTISNRTSSTTVPGFGTFGSASSTAAVTKSGGHTLTLSGQNTYSGATTINAGTLVYAADPVASGTTNGLATGTITSSPFGVGSVTIAGGTLSVDASRTIVNPMTFSANTSSFVDVPAGAELTNTGQITYTGTVTKTGAGLWRITAGNGSANAASVLNVNAGTVQLTDIFSGTGGSGDMNATAINVNNGGTFIFGSSPAFGSENPDLPNGTYITVNTGGTVTWNIGEDYGGINLFGGAIGMRGNINLAGASASEIQSGTISKLGGSPGIGGAQTLNKTTPGTVMITGVPLNNTGGLNIQDGVLSTDSAIASVSGSNPITAPITFGTATTAGTLRYTANTNTGTLSRSVTINAGGGTIDVSDPAGTLTYSGVASGSGPFTKAGPGTLVLSGSNSYTGGTTISGGTLQIGAGTAGGAITGNVSIASGGTLAFNRSDDLSFAGNITGAGGLSKQGAGIASLTGTVNYTGATNIAGGTLRLAPAMFSAVTVADGASLAIVNATNAASTLTATSIGLGAAGSTIRFELDQATNPTVPLLNVTQTEGLALNGGSHTIAISDKKSLSVGQFKLIAYSGANISSGFTLAPLPARTQGALVYAASSIDLNVTGVDSIKWNGNASNVWDQGSDINVGGTMNFKLSSNSSATNFVANDVVVFDDSAAGATTIEINDALQPSSATFDNASKNYTIQSTSGTGSIAGTGSITKQNTGTLNILTNNTYTGGTAVAGGTLNIGNGGTTGDIGAGPLTITAGAVVWNRSDDISFSSAITNNGSISKPGSNNLGLSGPLTGTGTIAMGGGALTLIASSDYTYSGIISGPAAISKQGTGVVTLAGNNTYSGGTTINSGTLQVGAGGSSGAIVGDVSVVGVSGANGALFFNRSDTYTYAGNINSNGGRIVNAGTGNTILAGVITQSSTSPGTIAAQNGTLTLANPNTTGLFGTVSASSGATVAIDTTAGDTTYANIFSGQGTLAKVGTGTATLTAANSFTGSLQINAGTLILADPGAGTGTSGDINATDISVNSGGTFIFGQGGIAGENPDLPDTTFITIKTGGTVFWRVGEQIGGIHLQGGTLSMDGGGETSNGVSETWTSGTVTTTGATAFTAGGGVVITKNTSGTVNVTGAAIVGSVLDIQEGTVAFANAGNLGSAAVRLGSATTTGTFEYQGATASRAGAFALNGGGVVRVTQAATALTLSGVFSGTGNLAKDGPGTLILTGTNTYTGGTTITSGALLANGQTGTNSATGSGPVTVGGGAGAASLGGTGGITGPLTLADSGKLAPGDAPSGISTTGILSVTKTVTFNANSTFEPQIGDASASLQPAKGTDYDQLVVKGTGQAVTIADGAILNLQVLPGVQHDQVFTVLDQTGGGTLAGAFRDTSGNLLSEGALFSAGGQNFLISYANGDVTVSAVPEPASIGLSAAAAGLLLLRRRRRA
jgi:autotransporter-associated beta strand protein